MNRRIRKELSNIRDSLDEIDFVLNEERAEEMSQDEPTGEPTFAEDVTDDLINWSAADEPAKDKVYMKDLRELTELKGLTIVGQIKTVFDLKSYIHPKTQQPGIIYRFVLSDKTGDMTVISFDDMATELKQYMIGQILKITNAWKMEVNKSNVMELHVGNFAKVEVVE